MSRHDLVSVVVAISDREAHPQKITGEISAALRSAGYACEFVFVLDGPVGPVEQELQAIDCGFPVYVVRLQGGGLGESIALSAGVAKAKGRFILNVPPYLQMQPEDLSKVLAALEAGADCVATWRTPRVDPWLNQLQSRLFNWVLRLVMGIPFHDLNSGTRGFQRQVLEEVSVYGELYRFLPVLARRQGFKVVEVKVRHREEKGRSGFYGIGVYLRRLLDILAITFLTRFTQRPLRFFGYLGFAAMVSGVAMAAQPLYMKVFERESLTDRPLFVIGAILVAFGVQLIGFGLVGEIIIFTQSPNMRDYKVEDEVEGGAGDAPPAGDADLGAATAAPAPHPAPAATAGPGAVARIASATEPRERDDEPPPPAAAGGGGGAASASAGLPTATATAAAPARRGLRATELDNLRAASSAGQAHVGNGTASAPLLRDPLPLRVRELLPGEDARWDAYISRHPLGTFFHLSGWSRAVRETFKHEPHPLVVEQGRRWLGVLPLFFVKSPFLGRNLVSVPYGVYGGVLSESIEAQQALLEAATALGRERRARYVELRHLEARPGDRPGSQLYVTFRKDLPADPEQVMPALPKKARAEARKARSPLRAADDESGKATAPAYGLGLRDDCSVDLLYQLFAENKVRLGSPPLPRRWFQALQDEFGRAVVIHRAVTPTGETLAAVMSFCFKDTVYAYYSGSRTGVNKTGVNDFIYCAIMEWAVQQGFQRFDFGRSRVDSGPASFKKNMGFLAEPLHYEYLLLQPDATMPDFHPSNPKLDLPRRIWSNMPMFVANRLGGFLSRYLP